VSCNVQVAAKEAEVTRLANEVDTLGLQLGRTRGELAKQVWPTACLYNHDTPCLAVFAACEMSPVSKLDTADQCISHTPLTTGFSVSCVHVLPYADSAAAGA
jgi:hypothetical protein